MWLSTPSVETLTRPRLAVALVSTVAAVSACYLVFQSSWSTGFRDRTGITGALHRSNAVRRSRRRDTNGSSSSSDAGGDENVQADHLAAEVETVVDVGADEWWNDLAGFQPSQRAGHNIVSLLFRVSEDNARRNGCVHRGCQCNACGMVPIRGVRYRCANCADFDLCETCEAQGIHVRTHIFYKIRVPAPPFGPRQMQPVWYTGDPDTCRRSLPRGLIAKLSRDTGFERPELEAFWEQWTFMAFSEWREDPDELGVAMDRRTFERCLVPTGGSRHAAPNLIHDRMFAFYDANNDGLISFSEFLHGLSYRRRKDKLRKVFEGYDIDGDGFVNRRDFLRMFRAYYVLYKQMHKDILDGLEDQLLASTDAAGVVHSRQPLSSLFGREGRVPPADGGMRFDGKTLHRDGTVVVDDGHRSTTIESRGDTATREDILTSLFAYETLQQPRRRFVAQRDTDTNWRTVRRLSANDADRAYWVTLLDPPESLDDLPDVLTGAGLRDAEQTEDEADDEADLNGHRSQHGGDSANGRRRTTDDMDGTDSERRARMLSRARRKAPKLEKRRRDMARSQLHERWRRRQFYLDEEEGGLAPDDWDQDEDVLAKLRMAANEAQATAAAAAAAAAQTRSRSSSKVRFAQDMDDFDTRSNPSTSSRSIPERWGGMGVPDAERDAGKEILYQVTQQAFNELLDTIFKPAEDLAVEAAETKDQRERFRAEIDAVDEATDKAKESDPLPAPEKADREKSAEDAVSEAMLTNAGMFERRNAVDLEYLVNLSDYTIPSESSVSGDDEPAVEEHRDPTMPQFRPNGPTEDDEEKGKRKREKGKKRPGSTEAEAGENRSGAGSSSGEDGPSSTRSSGSEPSVTTLRRWKQLDEAEVKAAARGGWGRLSFDEFEAIYKNQEDQGNRLDYLGSWIDFCIP
ncbi:hypothetical protein CDD80_687 [Ophiocordyceps camponoti-rufipedis]|uniref:Uncharacterized protein n=1 Tax=Ophiocordyceps camponoti-rufipedis TaxID=2004952 RepID=A0A2C5XNS8_9HYPO|nr:hypothetical protein CDD80_687 [Ophiocordyceps camponoti-rufipedis]